MNDERTTDAESRLNESESIQPTPIVHEKVEEPVAPDPVVVEEPTVGTGSYIGVSCALAMLVLTVILIGVVYLLRWI